MQRNQSRRAITLAGLIASSLGGMLAGCGDLDGGGTGDAMSVAEVRDFKISTLSSGELRAKNSVELRSQVNRQTTVFEIVPEGSRVKKGDVLVRLADDEIRNELQEEETQLSQRQLDLDAAEANYQITVSDNEANLADAKLQVELAEIALNQWRQGDDVKRIKELDAEIERTEREFERLDRKYKQSQNLFEQEFLSRDELDRDRIQYFSAKADYELAQLEKQVYMDYQRIQEEQQLIGDLKGAKQELARVRQQNEINLKNAESEVANRRARLLRQQEEVKEVQTELKNATITAPTDGLVVYGTTAQGSDSWRSQNEGPLEIGSQIRPNDLLIVLPDTSQMIATVSVHESIAGRVRPGQEASVTVGAVNDMIIDGVVEKIGVLAKGGGWRDPNKREYEVTVALEPTSDQLAELKPSMRVEAELVLGEVTQQLAVPVQAIFAEGPVRYVYTAEGAKFTRRPVQIGRQSDLWAEIRAGLDAGTEVLVREPAPGEVLGEQWDVAQLEAAGYTLDEDGEPTLKNPRGRFPGRGRPRGPAGGRRGASVSDASGTPDGQGDASGGDAARSGAAEATKTASANDSGTAGTAEGDGGVDGTAEAESARVAPAIERLD